MMAIPDKQARRRQRGASRRRTAVGMTLIELVVVTALLALMAALVVPNLVAVSRSRALRDNETAIVRLPVEARQEAIRSRLPVRLRFDGNNTLVMERVLPTDSNQTTGSIGQSGGVGASSTDALDEIDSPNQDNQPLTTPEDPKTATNVTTVKQITVDSELQLNGAQESGQSVDTGSWAWVAYPDGSAETAGVTFVTNGGGRLSLWIPAWNTDGGTPSTQLAGGGSDAPIGGAGALPRWVTGDLPDTTDDHWTAGDLEQRDQAATTAGGTTAGGATAGGTGGTGGG